MSRNIAYKRVSTTQQDTVRQFHNTNIQFDAVYEDKLSGKNTVRPEFQRCLCNLSKGDTLHVWEVSRLSRNLTDLRTTVFSLLEKGVSVKFHKEGLEFIADDSNGMKSAMSKMQLNLMGTIAEFERALICERVREGVAAAKSRGIKIGAANPRYKRTDYSKTKSNSIRDTFIESFKDTLVAYRSTGATYQAIANYLNKQGKKTIRGCNFDAKAVQRMCLSLNIGEK